MNKTLPKLSGIALAISAASLLSGCATTETKTTSVSNVDLVKCSGVNKCKGHNDCKTASNACGGHASCKGHGFVMMPAKACEDVGGTNSGATAKTVSKADLIHCSGVNKCGGHNDCKTATNACAGHASCKGKGFVNTTSKSCGDLGGSES